MVKIVLVLLYLWKGQVMLEQKPFDSEEACQAAAEVRVTELVKDPRFDAGLFGACIPLEVSVATK